MKKAFFKSWSWAGALLLLALVLTPVWGADEKPWQDEAELSYVQTGGNTDIVTLSGKNRLKYRFSDQWAGTWDVGALYAETDGVKAAERYNTDLRVDYQFAEQLYFFGAAGWLQDKFSGIDERYYIGPGAGYHFPTGDRHLVSVEAGLNYASQAYINGTKDDYLEGRLFGKYEFVLTPKTKFSQTAEYLHNFNDSGKFYVIAMTGLTTTLTDILSVKLTYHINYANEPVPDDLENTDTIFTVALVVNF
jgi:putative salt-induced outer membrane protein